jgi:hypothetical protein
MLPAALKQPPMAHLSRVKVQHDADLATGRGGAALPGALRAKYPNAPREWAWQWVFPATRLYVDGESRERRRQHFHESVVQRAVKDAVRAAGSPRPATCHSPAILSRLTCSKPAATFGPSRNCLATATSVRR